MTALDLLIPMPRLLEVDHIDLAASPEVVWRHVRHENLATSPFIRALFAIRTLPSRLRGERDEGVLQIDQMVSTPEKPGFSLLTDDPPRELCVGAIGKVWETTIPFVHAHDVRSYAAFAEPDFVKVAWAIRVLPLGDKDARVELEVRVDATDEDAWEKFRRYFRFIGLGSHFIRHSVLHALADQFGAPDAVEKSRELPGDELLTDAGGQFTHGITIRAKPDAIWPWLVQMGCRRGGFYSWDALDNGGEPSAREVHPELMKLAVGDVIPTTREGDGGFEVLRLDAPRVLVLGGLFDTEAERQLPFASPRPPEFWQVTWTFVLEPLDAESTRLHVRARGSFSEGGQLHATTIRPVHWFMESAQLRNLKARAEGTLSRDTARDVLEGMGGAMRMLGALMTPFLGHRRTRWGCDEATANARLPGDALVPSPQGSWTHAIEINAPAHEVWPWVAQVGADRGGFYSYQWLENVAGCGLRNAETIHPEWQFRLGDELVLHPEMKPLTIVEMVEGSHFVAHGLGGEMSGTWLFMVVPIDERRCRFISRFRYDNPAANRLVMELTAPIGFAMDRRMLLGVKERAERLHATA